MNTEKEAAIATGLTLLVVIVLTICLWLSCLKVLYTVKHHGIKSICERIWYGENGGKINESIKH
jgi:hypothetical protein